jgi:hypothetical protein
MESLAVTVGIIAFLLCWIFDLVAVLAPTLGLALIVLKLVTLIIAVGLIIRGNGRAVLGAQR